MCTRGLRFAIREDTTGKFAACAALCVCARAVVLVPPLHGRVRARVCACERGGVGVGAVLGRRFELGTIVALAASV